MSCGRYALYELHILTSMVSGREFDIDGIWDDQQICGYPGSCCTMWSCACLVDMETCTIRATDQSLKRLSPHETATM